MSFLKSIYNTILFQPLLNILIFFAYIVPGNDVGVAIILLTILVRLLLFPLSKKSLRSQKALQELQPKVDEIRKKYKDDKEQQSKELMQFYKENKINPMSSCLPMLVQLPIIFALYRVFRVGITEESFQYLYSFTPFPESINPMFFGFLDLSTPNLVLAIMAGAFQFVQSWMIMGRKKKEEKGKPRPKAKGMAGAMSKQMMYFLPVMTVFIAMSLPSGLALYWIVTTLFAIGQQWLMFRKKDDDSGEEEKKGKGSEQRVIKQKAD